ncbi:hypothetical protein ACROYT_G034479 [Oculina patagonica]
MEDMSMVQTLRIWKDGVTFMEQGNFQDALMNFMALEGRTDNSQQLITSGRNLFNIGQTYLALGKMDMAAKAFEESVEKDKMLAVAHFMLGNVNLALNRNEKALKNFNDSNFYLRGNKLINYQQLGLKSKLYMCEILTNRAIAQSRLGDAQEARNDFLMALQSKVEPRHSIIEDMLLCWQSGQNVEPMNLPSHAVFQPQKRLFDAINEKRDFLGQSQVVAANELTKFPDGRKRSTQQPPSPTSPKAVEEEQLSEQHLPQAEKAASGRHALLTELRKNETRRSLKKVSKPIEPPKKPLPGLPERPSSPLRPPPSPRSQSPLRIPPSPRSGADRSPLPRKKVSAPVMPMSSKPPSKPLPPAPRSKSPLPPRRISSPAQFGKTRDVSVTVQLVLTRSIKVDEAASTQDLLRAAADTFKLSEDSFALWCMKNDQLKALQDQDLEEILQAPGNKPTVYCYEN